MKCEKGRRRRKKEERTVMLQRFCWVLRDNHRAEDGRWCVEES